MRKVIALESQPAVLALYWWSPWHHKFFQSSQDEMDVVARCAFPADRDSQRGRQEFYSGSAHHLKLFVITPVARALQKHSQP